MKPSTAKKPLKDHHTKGEFSPYDTLRNPEGWNWMHAVISEKRMSKLRACPTLFQRDLLTLKSESALCRQIAKILYLTSVLFTCSYSIHTFSESPLYQLIRHCSFRKSEWAKAVLIQTFDVITSSLLMELK